MPRAWTPVQIADLLKRFDKCERNLRRSLLRRAIWWFVRVSPAR